ncbi:MAG TPA: hypothetical protein VL461_12885 [Dictyobacter sp.]|nr:hypothetical protein [Dictyobacter sp.]
MKSKKQFGMYSITLNDDGSLQIQAPTLLKPLIMDAQLVQDLQKWLQEQTGSEQPETPSTIIPIPNAPITSSPPIAPLTPAPDPTATSAPEPDPTATSAPEPDSEPPDIFVQRLIKQIIQTTQEQTPERLAPENRDRFVEQVTRNAALRPLMSQGKITYKQILLWVEQQLGTSL